MIHDPNGEYITLLSTVPSPTGTRKLSKHRIGHFDSKVLVFAMTQ